MQATRLLKLVALLFVTLYCICTDAYSQERMWMKGLWKEYGGKPYKQPRVHCTNILQITAVADSSFAALQTTFFAADTAVRVTYNCTGVLTQDSIRFSRNTVAYKKNSPKPAYAWNICARCSAQTCSLYVEHNNIILLLATTGCDSICNGTIAYYRSLNDFDTATQQQLAGLYSLPQYSSVYASYRAPATQKKHSILPVQRDAKYVDSSLVLDSLANLPPVLTKRISKLAQTLQVTSPNVEVILLDDAEIDGDIVSLYHNNTEVLSHKTLGKEVIKYSFKADKEHAYHELVLVAENLGSIPPNTALMRIRAGDKKYELTTRANLQENAKVIIEYSGE